MQYPCPACGFEVFDDPPGSYDICPVCDWEDDSVQLQFPSMRGGANIESLFEHQSEILKGLPLSVKEVEAYRRDERWRPLTTEDCGAAEGMPQSGREYFESIDTAEPKYYWR